MKWIRWDEVLQSAHKNLDTENLFIRYNFTSSRGKSNKWAKRLTLVYKKLSLDNLPMLKIRYL